MSSPLFPIGILFQGTKLICRIPKGISENVMILFQFFNPDGYNSNTDNEKKTVYFSTRLFSWHCP
jgi:hypothetical protein